jgi:hypothetical protein
VSWLRSAAADGGNDGRGPFIVWPVSVIDLGPTVLLSLRACLGNGGFKCMEEDRRVF